MDVTRLPHPPHRLPLLGDLLGGDVRRRPLQTALANARELGPIFTRRFLDRDVVFVCGADLVAEVSDETRFAKHVAPGLAMIRRIAGDGLFTAYNHEPNWQKAHDVLLPAFAMSSMRTYHPTMLKVARTLIGSWDAHVGGEPVRVAEDMTKLTMDTIGLAGFGYDFGSFERETEHPFVSALARSLGYVQAKTRELPWTAPLHRGDDRRFEQDVALMNKIVDDVIAARKASGERGTGDLLGLMLDGGELDEVNIRNQVITFLIAGHETTSGALSFALHYLVKNPVVLARAQAEVDAMWGDAERPDPDFADVGKLRYVRQILNEALRLWPTAAAFAREAIVDTTIGGHPIHKGQWVMVLAPALHRDAVWGDNVEAFDPDRFTPEREKARPVHAFKPFGTGERACIGRQFALHEATLLLGLLIHRYRLIDHANYQLEIKETLTVKPTGFTLKLARRTERVSVTAPAQDVERTVAGQAKAGTALRVLHGSNLGTCREFARRIADDGKELGFDTAVAPLDDYAGGLPTDGPVVIVAASYNGRPTDDAVKFTAALSGMDGSGVSYAVLGVGDRNWAATYQRMPALLDAGLAETGAKRLVERGEADASGDLDGDVAGWSARMWQALLETYGDPGAKPQESPMWTVTTIGGDITSALDERHGLRRMTVLSNEELVDVEHPLGRSKRHLRIALPDGVTYRTADHLTVLPDNRPELVERAARLLRLDLDELIAFSGRAPLPIDRPVTVRQLLTHFVELQDAATAEHVRLLAEHNPCPPERAALRANGKSLLDIMEAHPAGTMPLEVFLRCVPAMRPRHYSISSSPLSSPTEIDLMVSPLRSSDFVGVGSHHVTRLQPGDTVRARVSPCREAFRLPQDGPVIMVSAGTGLAPFRGGIADRVARGVTAPALCYFGCDHPDVDYLHRAEFEAAEAAGAVRMRPTFWQAPEHGWEFVQHRIVAEQDEVWELLEAGARVYVCGDGRRMSPAVRQSFLTVHSARTGADMAKSQRWLDELIATDRYVEDVYAG
ncbi:cytochrome P450 [Allokutzneria albata]|uniref:Bifunctional cytochrome P450/NADPH--P450 reductase n=1 Tax=Allokutzneria albata TaxID=211114 RepID=A0A1G9TNL3_ALLAB|nr:cytochrome P450 [Allokutzneria albata]SDM49337.1 cytochrome P450 / NADPH-cytochrome P450 reductase [Allokutzneria albata]